MAVRCVFCLSPLMPSGVDFDFIVWLHEKIVYMSPSSLPYAFTPVTEDQGGLTHEVCASFCFAYDSAATIEKVRGYIKQFAPLMRYKDAGRR